MLPLGFDPCMGDDTFDDPKWRKRSEKTAYYLSITYVLLGMLALGALVISKNAEPWVAPAADIAVGIAIVTLAIAQYFRS